MKKENEIRIGTSGWMYKAWHDKLYPAGVKNFLTFYSACFNTVEINNTFYHLPKAETFDKWYGESGKGFTFAVKMSRAITHNKKLEEAADYLKNFLRNSASLKEKRGPILIQLPPSLKYDGKKLKDFFLTIEKVRKSLKQPRIRFALEPRNASWFTDRNLEEGKKILKRFNVAPVFAQSGKFLSFDPDSRIETDFVYVRLHGPEDFSASQYAAKLLKPWAARIKRWSNNGFDVFLYFNNDVHGYAILDARILLKLISSRNAKMLK